MHKENLVVSVVANGDICRESSGRVYLPFGTEYSLQIKNLDSRRAVVKITIDGEDVLDGTSIIVAGNSTCQIKGALKGNLAHNSFKFVQLTDRIRDYKGDRADWGLISVSFQFEQVPQYTPRPPFQPRKNPWQDNDPWVSPYKKCPPQRYPDIICSTNSVIRSSSVNVDPQGLTVPGSVVDQQFVSTNLMGSLSPGGTITLHLIGETSEKPVVKVLTTNKKEICPTCGVKSKKGKYCLECGTCLI